MRMKKEVLQKIYDDGFEKIKSYGFLTKEHSLYSNEVREVFTAFHMLINNEITVED